MLYPLPFHSIPSFDSCSCTPGVSRSFFDACCRDAHKSAENSQSSQPKYVITYQHSLCKKRAYKAYVYTQTHTNTHMHTHAHTHTHTQPHTHAPTHPRTITRATTSAHIPGAVRWMHELVMGPARREQVEGNDVRISINGRVGWLAALLMD